jgi:hypothetical protein
MQIRHSLLSIAMTIRILRAFLIAAAALFGASATFGHVMPLSAVVLDFEHDSVGADVILPMQDLEIAFKHPLLHAPGTVISRYEPALRQYLLEHIHSVALDGRPWSVAVQRLWVNPGEFPPDLCARIEMVPPRGASLRRFTLNYDAIVHEVVSHKALVFVRNDWNAAQFLNRSQIPPMQEARGLVRYLVYSVAIDRTEGSFWNGFALIFKLGMEHIGAGLDHLLFLFVLLLPVPLAAGAKRWGVFRGTRQSFLQVLKIVTAFTIGHSLTLILGATGWMRLPQRPIEILIALTIVVSAIHAIRPVFASWEAPLAAGFGLVHGLAFSSAIAQFGFSPWHIAMTIFAFNLGIEVMQIAFVVAVIPILILLSQSRHYAPARIGGAAMAGLAAMLWVTLRPGF